MRRWGRRGAWLRGRCTTWHGEMRAAQAVGWIDSRSAFPRIAKRGLDNGDLLPRRRSNFRRGRLAGRSRGALRQPRPARRTVRRPGAAGVPCVRPGTGVVHLGARGQELGPRSRSAANARLARMSSALPTGERRGAAGSRDRGRGQVPFLDWSRRGIDNKGLPRSPGPLRDHASHAPARSPRLFVGSGDGSCPDRSHHEVDGAGGAW